MRTQTALKALLAVAVAAVLTAASASATSTSAVACTLLSSSQLKSTLKRTDSTVLRNYDPTGAGSMAVDTECDWGVWSGAPPTSPAATFALARAGHAAQTGIETWAPHQGHERDWVAKGYPELIKELTNGSYAAPDRFRGPRSAGAPRFPRTPPRPFRDRPHHEAARSRQGPDRLGRLLVGEEEPQSDLRLRRRGRVQTGHGRHDHVREGRRREIPRLALHVICDLCVALRHAEMHPLSARSTIRSANASRSPAPFATWIPDLVHGRLDAPVGLEPLLGNDRDLADFVEQPRRRTKSPAPRALRPARRRRRS